MNEQRQRVIDEIKADNNFEEGATITACVGEPFCHLQVACPPSGCPLCQIERYDEDADEWVMIRRAPYLQ